VTAHRSIPRLCVRAGLAVAAAWVATGQAASPAELTAAIRGGPARPDLAVRVQGFRLGTGLGAVFLDDGVLVPAEPVAGRPVEWVFVGDGRAHLEPPDEVERGQMELFTGAPVLDERFDRAVFAIALDAASDGDVELYQGDDYANADGRALAWTNAAGSWPDLTGATVKLVVRAPNGDLIQVTGSVVTPTGAGQTVRVELTAAQTALLEEWPNASALRVVAWLSPSGRRTTLVDADLAVIEDLLD